MLIRRVVQSIRNQDWAAVLIEILVVMIGLLMAFQVDRWWEARGEGLREGAYIASIVSEVEADVSALEYAVALAEVRLGFADLLMRVATDSSAALAEPGMFLVAVSQAAYTYTPTLASYTFEDLLSTGGLRLIRDPDIKRALHKYYSYDDAQRQYIDLNLRVEFRYFQLSADILNYEQHQFVEDGWYVVHPGNIEQVRSSDPGEEGVNAAARRLMMDQELLAWLPRVRRLQVDQITAHSGRLENARSLLASLGEYQGTLGN